MEKEKEKKKSIDYIFESLVGGGSYYQWTTIAIMLPLSMIMGYPLMLFLFTSYVPEHRCRVPICDDEDGFNPNALVNSDFLNFAVPDKHNAKEFLNDGYAHDPCNVYPILDASAGCVASNFGPNKTSCDGDFIYSTDLYPETLSTRFNLVCEDQTKQRLLGTFTMTGLLLGSLIGGRSGDYFGRKKVLYAACLVISVVLGIASLSTSYAMFAACHIIYSTCLPISWICYQSITTEFFSPGYRKKAWVVKDAIGIPMAALMCFIVYMMRDWRYLQLTIAFLGAFSLITWFFTHESVRWLAQNNKKEEAKDMLLHIAKRNKRKLSPEQINEIDVILGEVATSHDGEESKKLSVMHMFKRQYIFTTGILIIGWICTNLGYYSLSLNATKLSGNIFLNFFLGTMADSPTVLIFYLTLDRFGRKWNMVFFQALLGISCLILAFLPKENFYAFMFVYMLGKLGATASFALVWLITIELYPTNLRTQAIGLCSATARLFGLGCPFVGNLAVYWKPLPMVLLGAPTIVVALLMTRLPETANKDLPQDFEDGAALNKQKEGNNNNNNNNSSSNNNDVVMQEKESKQ